jgi:hypothetical protein
MPNLAIIIGLILIAAGLIGYFGSGMESLTALIPLVPGALLAGLGALALWRPGARKHAMHAAAVIALLGLLGSLRGIPEFFALLGGQDVARPWAAVVQTVMAIGSAVFLVAAVRSFIAARRAQRAAVD